MDGRAAYVAVLYRNTINRHTIGSRAKNVTVLNIQALDLIDLGQQLQG